MKKKDFRELNEAFIKISTVEVVSVTSVGQFRKYSKHAPTWKCRYPPTPLESCHELCAPAVLPKDWYILRKTVDSDLASSSVIKITLLGRCERTGTTRRRFFFPQARNICSLHNPVEIHIDFFKRLKFQSSLKHTSCKRDNETNGMVKTSQSHRDRVHHFERLRVSLLFTYTVACMHMHAHASYECSGTWTK